MVDAVRASLAVPDEACVRVSYTGGVFSSDGLLLTPFSQALAAREGRYLLTEPLFAPCIGAALYAARCAGVTLGHAR